eukprot:CAMPEP_0175554396 /NCGR_PEP_ID=MMETSP0096-20121207/33834_1 /TAXON_ID=311494 /ORGANISM="Alexandrium monilatum, Strain CCMP3105" /LENGTH=216 /DNA_ID=CAMNT_0016857505 /DNA_START=166 /DNA_END=813 /DNA_ORIENTATION=-
MGISFEFRPRMTLESRTFMRRPPRQPHVCRSAAARQGPPSASEGRPAAIRMALCHSLPPWLTAARTPCKQPLHLRPPVSCPAGDEVAVRRELLHAVRPLVAADKLHDRPPHRRRDLDQVLSHFLYTSLQRVEGPRETLVIGNVLGVFPGHFHQVHDLREVNHQVLLDLVLDGAIDLQLLHESYHISNFAQRPVGGKRLVERWHRKGTGHRGKGQAC